MLVLCTSILHAQTWKEVNPPPNVFNDDIYSVAADSAGNIYAAGKFKNSKNENVVVKWNGQHWAELGAGNNSLKADNIIYCIAIDKKGNIYAAGGFTNSTGNYSISKWDGTTWSEVGGTDNALNPNGPIYAMTFDEKGNLFVAGYFMDSSGSRYVAEWNGSKWSHLGVGVNSLHANGYIYSLTTDAKGNVYAGGYFTNKNDKCYVAKWNGTDWVELGENAPLNASDYISCIKTDIAGNVYAGGGFKDSAGEYYIAKWNGVNWTEVGNGANKLNANGPFNAIEVTETGTVYAGGFGTDSNNNTNVIKWNNDTCRSLFSTNGAIRALYLDKAGDLYAVGDFRNYDHYGYIAKWNGVSIKKIGFWRNSLHTGESDVQMIAVDSKGIVYVAGIFSDPSLKHYRQLEQWDGETWSKVGGDTAYLNPNGAISAMTTDLSGNLYVTGNFTDSNGKYYIAKWNGHTWSKVGNSNNPIKIFKPLTLLACDKKGNVYAGGDFGESNGFSPGIMKWDGSKKTFYPYAGACSLLVDSAGNIYAGNALRDKNGKYQVDKINENGVVVRLGSGTNALNSGSKITALAIDRNGNLLASGANNEGYNKHSAFVAKWDGTTWSRAGSDSGRYVDGSVSSMVTDDLGNVYAASSLSDIAYFSVAKWDGSKWSELGQHNYFNSDINSLAIGTKGNIYAVGLFSNGYYAYVAEYEEVEVSLDSPMLSAVADQYCNAAGWQSVKITNLPDTSNIAVSVKLDNADLALKADSSFTFNLSTLLLGQHEIEVSYSTHSDTTFLIKDFNVTAAVTPVVKMTSSTSISTGNDPVIITANPEGGGTNPTFIFSKDRNMNIVLQQESSNNTLILNPGELAEGKNLIYVTMRTSENCYTNQTSMDSIAIRRSTAPAAGITDPDYPDQKILPYPNPFSETIRIKGFQDSKSYTVLITNSMGKTIFQKTFNNSTDIIIRDIHQQGIYWITVYDNTQKHVLGSVSVIKN